MATLKYMPEARASLQFFRDSDALRAKALDDALDDIRAGNGQGRSRRDEVHNVWLTDVWVTGRPDYDLIVWEVLPDDVIAIIHAGRAKL